MPYVNLTNADVIVQPTKVQAATGQRELRVPPCKRPEGGLPPPDGQTIYIVSKFRFGKLTRQGRKDIISAQ